MVKVSVIVPNYNHKRYLKRRLESILNQSFQDYELIVLDDASTDDSLSILETYKNHPKVSHFIVNVSNSGSPFKTWRQGIELAKGDYIWIAESDDYADVYFLEKTVSVLASNEKSGMVFTDSMIIDENDNHLRFVSENYIFNELKSQKNIINKYNLSLFLLKHLLIPNASSVLFRREAMLKLDFLKLGEFKNTGDRFTYLSIAFESNIVFIDVPLNYMRLHGKNTTKFNIKNGVIYNDRLMVLNWFFKDFIKLKSNHTDLIFYLKKLYLPCIDYKYYHGIRKILRTYYHYDLLNLKEFLVLSGYSFLPVESFFFRTKIKEFIKKL